MESAPGALPLFKRLMSLVISSLVDGSANVLSIGTCGSLAMDSLLIADDRLSTLRKCSEQGSSIFSLSEIIVFPSEEWGCPRRSRTVDGLESAVEVPHALLFCVGLDGAGSLAKPFILHAT